MSILIKNMEMPPVGTGKVIMIDSDGDVWDGGKDEYTVVAVAKAVPVPKHGDLIERDMLISVISIMSDKSDNPVVWEQMRYIVEDMTTIIPADEGET